MSVKTNEEKAQEFLNKYSEYKDTKGFFDEIINIRNKYQEQGIEPSEFEIRSLMLNLDNKYDEIAKINQPIENEIRKELKSFSQELLVTIYNSTKNENIKVLVKEQVKINNIELRNLNELELESGFIFVRLKDMSKEDKIKLLKLRESEEDIKLDEIELLKLSPIVREYIFKSINNDLTEEKELFCKEHGINSEIEFKQYVDWAMQQEARKIAGSLQDSINNLLNLNDSSLIDKMEERLNNNTTSIKK